MRKLQDFELRLNRDWIYKKRMSKIEKVEKDEETKK